MKISISSFRDMAMIITGVFPTFAVIWVFPRRSSPRKADVYTDQPGVQFYTANWLEQGNGKSGAFYHARTAFCFETQNFPDAVNKPHFPSPIVKAGKEWKSVTGYHFYIHE